VFFLASCFSFCSAVRLVDISGTSVEFGSGKGYPGRGDSPENEVLNKDGSTNVEPGGNVLASCDADDF